MKRKNNCENEREKRKMSDERREWKPNHPPTRASLLRQDISLALSTFFFAFHHRRNKPTSPFRCAQNSSRKHRSLAKSRRGKARKRLKALRCFMLTHFSTGEQGRKKDRHRSPKRSTIKFSCSVVSSFFLGLSPCVTLVRLCEILNTFEAV